MQTITTRIRKLKFWLNLTRAYFTRYQKWILGLIIAFVVTLYSLTKLASLILRSNVITIGYVGNYSVENIPTSILALVTDSLVKTDDAGRPLPSLASHWTSSQDGRTYIVFLKDNLKWHDGTPVDARDITIAIENVQVSGLNNKAIELKLASPISSFPTILDKPIFKTKSFYGVGQYRITDIDRIAKTVKRISLAPNRSQLPRVDIRFYQTEVELLAAIKIGEVKLASVASASRLETWANLEVARHTDFSEIVTIFLNTEDPLLSSKELRQALAHSIDRSQFDGRVATTPISPKSWAYVTGTKKYEYNTGRAKELFAKSQTKNPKITLSVIGGYNELAASIKSNWQDIGIDVEITRLETIPENFQALLVLNKIPSDPDQYALWHSTQRKTNLTKVKNVKIDKLLEDARTLANEEDRIPLYGQFQETLMEELPAIFLYHPYKYQVVYKNLKTQVSNLPINK